jgi:hypothetical protein
MDDLRPATTEKPYNRWSYQRSSELGSRPKSEYIYLLALLIAAGADGAAFHQVVSLVMRTESDWMIGMLVAGLTVISLMLAHLGGRMARDTAAAKGKLTWRDVLICGIPWALLGIAAVIVRLKINPHSGGLQLNPGAAGKDEGTDKIAAALLFLVLYAASGMVAGVGEFLTRNPLRTAYRGAVKTMRKAQRKLAKSQPAYQRSLAVREVHLASFREDLKVLLNAKRDRIAFGEELKQEAQIMIAAHLQDPSATDGMTEPDWRPAAAPKPSRSWAEQNSNTPPAKTVPDRAAHGYQPFEQRSPSPAEMTNSHDLTPHNDDTTKVV